MLENKRLKHRENDELFEQSPRLAGVVAFFSAALALFADVLASGCLTRRSWIVTYAFVAFGGQLGIVHATHFRVAIAGAEYE